MSSSTEIISHWNTLIENFNTSPQVFYQAVINAINQRQIPDAKIETMFWNESHLLSARREYLKISFKREFYFAICGSPFGTGFFVSYWLLQPPAGCLFSLLEPFPYVGAFAKMLVKPWTYYRIDTAQMFQTATHSALLEVIDSITTSQGLRPLPETDRKPIVKGFLEDGK